MSDQQPSVLPITAYVRELHAERERRGILPPMTLEQFALVAEMKRREELGIRSKYAPHVGAKQRRPKK